VIDVQATVIEMLESESMKHEHKERKPGVFYPSEAMQCPRKIYNNVMDPAKGDEVSDMPLGLFHMGKYAETAIIKYIRDKYGEQLVEQERIDCEVAPGVIIHGYLDFALKDLKSKKKIKEGEFPKLKHIFEVKSASERSFSYSAKAEEAKIGHRAQLMCYLATKKVMEGSVIYVRRDDIGIIKQFDVQFDETLWEQIVENFKIVSVAQEKGCPPPPVPIEKWECGYCSYKNRCKTAMVEEGYERTSTTKSGVRKCSGPKPKKD
jgi:CRISPR/Cas system-associated exonuclease Cas4 (RecB family)